MSASAGADLAQRIEHIEAAYEYMLAFAAQGLSGDEASASVTQIRAELTRSGQAMDGLAAALAAVVTAKGLRPAERYRAFIQVVERDTDQANAAVQLVLSQPRISSQLVDNLNALIHLRAVLTDLFLIDEIIRSHP